MNTNELNIRDPYVLLHEGTYYLYGTRSATCWGPADGFDCYTSQDLKTWEGPFEVFHRPDGFFADRSYWAPECYFCGGRFYLIATLASEARKKAVYALVSESPLGPFRPVTGEPLTPPDWTSIDGSLHWEADGAPWLLFSHSFEDVPKGDLCAVALARDLSRAEGEPVCLFQAADAPWAVPIPFAREEFGMEGDVYFADGPCAHRMETGALAILWSSWSVHGYAVGVAVSDSGNIGGPWRHVPEALFPEDGGHGMLFRTKSGQLLYTLHSPDTKYEERPVFTQVTEEQGHLRLSRPLEPGT